MQCILTTECYTNCAKVWITATCNNVDTTHKRNVEAKKLRQKRHLYDSIDVKFRNNSVTEVQHLGCGVRW